LQLHLEKAANLFHVQGLQADPVYIADMAFAVGQLHNGVSVPILADIAFMVDSHRAIDYRLATITARRNRVIQAANRTRYWNCIYVVDRPAD
jgi:hypothetical protein